MAYARPPVADEAGLGDYYSGYLDRHKNDSGFDATIYASNPYNVYSDDAAAGYAVLPEVTATANRGNQVKSILVKRRAPGHDIPYIRNLAQRLPLLLRRGRQAATAVSKAVIRKSPFLREESGAYVKDLSGSYLARITPETKNVKSILGNQFVEEENHNTVRPAKYFRDSPPDTLLGDRKVPLSRIRYFMGLRDGKLRIGKIDDFDDDDEVVPVWNKTALVRRMESRAPYEQRDSAYSAFLKYDDLHDATSNPAYKDSSAYYYDVYNRPNVYKTEGDSAVHLPPYGDEFKSLLVSPGGNAMFLNDAADFTGAQRDMVNGFLEREGGAYPVMLDNGRYAYFLEGKDADYDKYVSSDFYRDPRYFWAIGELGKYVE